MKDNPRSPSAKKPLAPSAKHQLEHAVPTVIHNPEDDMSLLARWLRHAMENQTRFWTLISGLVAVVVLIAVLANGLSLGRDGSDEAWTELATAKTPGDRVAIAKEFAKTPASQFALLQAATEYFNQGFNDLPANRDVALPRLKQALDLFEQVEHEAPQDSPQARVAALGAARALEARNQLDKAIAKYKEVAKTWPDTNEAKEAERLVRLLQKPESQEFYKALYAYKAPTATLPPGSTERLNWPPGHPRIDTKSMTVPSPLLLPPPPPSPAPNSKAGKPAETTPLPADVFTPPTQPAPKAEPEKPASKAGSAQPELPENVFSPRAKEGAPKF